MPVIALIDATLSITGARMHRRRTCRQLLQLQPGVFIRTGTVPTADRDDMSNYNSLPALFLSSFHLHGHHHRQNNVCKSLRASTPAQLN